MDLYVNTKYFSSPFFIRCQELLENNSNVAGLKKTALKKLHHKGIIETCTIRMTQVFKVRLVHEHSVGNTSFQSTLQINFSLLNTIFST